MTEDQEHVYTLQETTQKLGVSLEIVEGWLRDQFITPSVMADHSDPFLDENDIRQLEQIKNLADIGYGPQEIKKIVRKIGLPKPDRLTSRKRRLHHYLTVGELAKQSGLNRRTIKYWEERGVIEPTGRSEGGFRMYDEYYIQICQLIQDLQLFGYSLDEIKRAADLFRALQAVAQKTFSGTEREVFKNLDEMMDLIAGFRDRMDDFMKGIDRWKKLLKEKQAEIQALKRKLSKESKTKSRANPALPAAAGKKS